MISARQLTNWVVEVFKYLTYFGHPLFVGLCLSSSFISNVTSIGMGLWLSFWVNAYTKEEAVNIAFYLGIYIAISLCDVLTDSVLVLIYARGTWSAAGRLHQMFIQAVMRAPLSWFRNVPVGRIVNRVSRDMMSLDTNISYTIIIFVEQVFKLLLSVAAISSIIPVFVLPAVMLSFLGILAGEVYTRTSVVVKKLLASSQSPVFSQFSDTLAGLPVVRARESMPQQFEDRLAEHLRAFTQAMAASFSTCP